MRVYTKKNWQKLTTNAGAPILDNQNITTAGKRITALLQDVRFLEKLGHFDRKALESIIG